MSRRAPDASTVFPRLNSTQFARLPADVRKSAAAHYNAAKKGALPAKMRGSYETLAACCLLIASQASVDSYHRR